MLALRRQRHLPAGGGAQRAGEARGAGDCDDRRRSASAVQLVQLVRRRSWKSNRTSPRMTKSAADGRWTMDDARGRRRLLLHTCAANGGVRSRWKCLFLLGCATLFHLFICHLSGKAHGARGAALLCAARSAERARRGLAGGGARPGGGKTGQGGARRGGVTRRAGYDARALLMRAARGGARARLSGASRARLAGASGRRRRGGGGGRGAGGGWREPRQGLYHGARRIALHVTIRRRGRRGPLPVARQQRWPRAARAGPRCRTTGWLAVCRHPTGRSEHKAGRRAGAARRRRGPRDRERRNLPPAV